MTDSHPIPGGLLPTLATFARRRPWALLVGLSLALGAVLTALNMPGAMLLAPLLAAILLSLAGTRVRQSANSLLLAQGVIGCMMAKGLPPSVVGEMGAHWGLFAASVLSVLAVCGLLGWTMTRLGVLPGSTALWGLAPGAASAMILLAEDYGADARLVAIMQYLRVVLAVSAASLVTRLWGLHPQAHATAVTVDWFAPLHWLPFTGTLALAIAGPLLSRWLKFQGGALLLPIVGGMALTHFGWLTIELPRWLLALAYALVGWRIGTRFTPELLAYAARMLPRLLGCTVALVLACGGIGVLLVLFAGIDPLTAYLATSPGGADSVAAVAAGSHADVPFVMTLQISRFLATLLIGPLLMKLIARNTAEVPA